MNEQERKIATGIFESYEEKSETAFERLKRTHAKAQLPAKVFGYTFGSFSALIMGAGMSLIMTDITSLGDPARMIVGALIGVVGMLLATVNYFAYKKLLKKGKEKYAAEIMAYKQEILG